MCTLLGSQVYSLSDQTLKEIASLYPATEWRMKRWIAHRALSNYLRSHLYEVNRDGPPSPHGEPSILKLWSRSNPKYGTSKPASGGSGGGAAHTKPVNGRDISARSVSGRGAGGNGVNGSGVVGDYNGAGGEGKGIRGFSHSTSNGTSLESLRLQMNSLTELVKSLASKGEHPLRDVHERGAVIESTSRRRRTEQSLPELDADERGPVSESSRTRRRVRHSKSFPIKSPSAKQMKQEAEMKQEPDDERTKQQPDSGSYVSSSATLQGLRASQPTTAIERARAFSTGSRIEQISAFGRLRDRPATIDPPQVVDSSGVLLDGRTPNGSSSPLYDARDDQVYGFRV